MEKHLLTAVLFAIFSGHCTYSCPDGTYGYNCGYTCNCDLDMCHPISGCRSSNCSQGWSGPTCHKHNIARGKPTSSSGEGPYPSSRATDGNTSANGYEVCIETRYSNPNWWRVDLSDTVLIRDVTIYFRTDFIPRRNGIHMFLTNSTATPSGSHCYTVTGNRSGTDINDTISVPCQGRGRYVLLYTTTANVGDIQPKMDFCEVKVDECDPGTFDANCENYCHCKDGVCNDITGVCPLDGCLAGWKGSKCDVTCLQGTEYGSGCLKTCSSRMCQGDTSACPRDTGRCRDGCQEGWKGEDCTTACLNGAEYGSGCLKNCSSRMCQGDTSICPRDTGRCRDGCQAGWKGEDCTTACLQGTEYGSGCVKNCSSRMCQGDTSTCPRDAGWCTDGCQAGWKGEDCTLECPTKLNYGPSCHGSCSVRKCKEAMSPCPRDTGQCDGGCQSGWEGEDCMLECQSHTFGVDCSSTCGHCVGDEPCHHVTGTCLKGCSPGWVSDTCLQAANSLPGNPTEQISPLAAGFIGAFAMLVLLAVVAGAVCLWRKGGFRMTKTSSQQPGTPDTRPTPPVEVPTYDVLPEHDYTKLDGVHTEHYDTLQSTVEYQNSDVRI